LTRITQGRFASLACARYGKRDLMAKRRSQSPKIQCRLSRLMGEKRVRIIDVSRATGISRNMLSKLYYDRAQRVDLDDIAKLCDYLECPVADLFEIAP
jgi:putative transcriptional regulator